MALDPTFYFPVDNTQAKAVAAAPYSTGVLVALWPNNETWYFNGSGLVTSGIVSGAGNSGFSSIVTDFASGVWLSQYSGYLAHSAPGSATTLYTLPSGEITSGGAFVPAYNSFYTIGSGGQIYLAIGGLAATVGTALGTGSFGLATSGTTLFTIQAPNNGIAELNLSTATSGPSGFFALPAGLKPTCIAASSLASSIAVGGWSYASIASGFSQMFSNPAAPYIIGLSPTSNTINLYSDSAWGVWVPQNIYLGVGSPTYGSWSPDGLHFTVSDPLNSILSVYTFAFGSGISTLQFPFTNAGPTTWVSPNNFLLCELASGSIVSIYSSLLTWTVANSVVVTGLSCITTKGQYQAIAGVASGLAFLNVSRNSNNVIIQSQTALPFTPLSVASDNFGSYAVGNSGPSGYLSILNGQVISQTLTWTGSAVSVATFQDQILVLDSSVPTLRVFGYLSGTYQQIYRENSVASNMSNISITSNTPFSSGGSIFVYGSPAAWQYQFVSPFGVVRARNAALSFYLSGVWTPTITLGFEKTASALVYDALGNVFVTTVQNDLYYVTAASGVSGYSVVAPYSSQLTGVPLGMSSLVIYNNMLYATSSLAGFLVQLNPTALGPPIPPIGTPPIGLLGVGGLPLLSTTGGVLLPG